MTSEKPLFYQLFRNSLYNFSTHLLTVLTKCSIVILQLEQRGGVCYEFDEIYTKIDTVSRTV